MACRSACRSSASAARTGKCWPWPSVLNDYRRGGSASCKSGMERTLMLALDLFVIGLIFGLFFALMAVGLAMIFGVLKIVNFAHGEFYMIGAYVYVLVSLKLGVSPWIALPLAALGGAALGWLVVCLLLCFLFAGFGSWSIMKDEYAVVVTFGLSLLLINLVDKIVGPYPYRGPTAKRDVSIK